MIKIEALRIVEFRGIRDLTISPGGKSCVVSGPNGSGKSGVIDAIDFAITGDISRLRGAGSSGLSVQKNAPHVHQRADPSKAVVEMTVRHLPSGKTATLTRHAGAPRTYVLMPDDPEVRQAIDELGTHPEIALSRRDIIRYVVSPATERAQGINALLKLDRLGQIRQLLMSTSNKLKQAAANAASTAESDRQSLCAQLGVTELEDTEVLLAVNKRRVALGLPELPELSPAVAFDDGVEAATTRQYDKGSLTQDLASLDQALTDRSAITAAALALIEVLDEIEAVPDYALLIGQRELLTRGLTMVNDELCPLCDASWPDVESLRLHLLDKKMRSDSAASLHDRFSGSATALTQLLAELGRILTEAENAARLLNQEDPAELLLAWQQELLRVQESVQHEESAVTLLRRLAASRPDPGEGPEGVEPRPLELGDAEIGCPENWQEARLALNDALTLLPDPSEENQARTFLSKAQDRRQRCLASAAAAALSSSVRIGAQTAYEQFCGSMDTALTVLYSAVESDFSAYYRSINSDDEESFTADLVPASGKLDLLVDFYGLAKFPPNAYHSEGHQDSMGLCLYLALMKRLLGPDFQLAVLDDVVMSVDSGHRRELCRLLKDTFPDVQFIITTHDEVWARQLVSTGLVTPSGRTRFSGWTVNEGPRQGWAPEDWSYIESHIQDNDVPAAAARLRRTVEGLLTEVAENLRAKVTYKADGSHDLGDLLSGVGQAHKKALDLALKSARSWGNTAKEEEALQRDIERKAVILAKGSDDWALNVAVHYNEWADLSSQDFAPVVAAWKAYFGLFRCNNSECASTVSLSGPPRDEDSLRCACTDYDLNLRVRTA